MNWDDLPESSPEDVAWFNATCVCWLDGERSALTDEQFSAVEAEWRRRGEALGDDDVALLLGLPLIASPPISEP